MENQSYQDSGVFNSQRYVDLPNATAVLVLGIISIVVCCCYGVIGMICGTIALVLARRDTRMYMTNPGMYSEKSYNNLKAGKICAIIGLVLSSLVFVYAVYMIATLGMKMLSDPQFMKEILSRQGR